jgi:hypothetical protein
MSLALPFTMPNITTTDWVMFVLQNISFLTQRMLASFHFEHFYEGFMILGDHKKFALTSAFLYILRKLFSVDNS